MTKDKAHGRVSLTRVVIPLAFAATALLAGCATHVETQKVAAEVTRLCEREAGVYVYRPTTWSEALRAALLQPSKKIRCTHGVGVCREWPATAVYEQVSIGVAPRTSVSGISKYKASYFDQHDGALIAEKIMFFGGGYGPAAEAQGPLVFSCEDSQRSLPRATGSLPGGAK